MIIFLAEKGSAGQISLINTGIEHYYKVCIGFISIAYLVSAMVLGFTVLQILFFSILK